MTSGPRQEIADGVTRVYKELYGRGPERVAVHLLPDVVLCVLEGVNTAGQSRLVALGELGLLHAVHSRLQRGVQAELVAVVERVTGRSVRCYVPGFDGSRDAATDAFLLDGAGP